MKLVEYLDQLAWTQKELSREAGISANAVQRAVRGEEISRETAGKIKAAIARRLKKPAEELIVEGMKMTPLMRRRATKRKPKADAEAGIEQVIEVPAIETSQPPRQKRSAPGEA